MGHSRRFQPRRQPACDPRKKNGNPNPTLPPSNARQARLCESWTCRKSAVPPHHPTNQSEFSIPAKPDTRCGDAAMPFVSLGYNRFSRGKFLSWATGKSSALYTHFSTCDRSTATPVHLNLPRTHQPNSAIRRKNVCLSTAMHPRSMSPTPYTKNMPKDLTT
jgi:hypothetical protein